MKIQSKYFKPASTVIVVTCTCDQTIMHDLKAKMIRCPACGKCRSLELAIEDLLIRLQSPDRPIEKESALASG